MNCKDTHTWILIDREKTFLRYNIYFLLIYINLIIEVIKWVNNLSNLTWSIDIYVVLLRGFCEIWRETQRVLYGDAFGGDGLRQFHLSITTALKSNILLTTTGDLNLTW